MTSKQHSHSVKLGRQHPSFDPEVGRRISTVIASYPTRKAAAEAAGKSTDMLSAYERGENEPPFSVLQRLAHDRGISLDWLATGRGPMRIGEAVPAVPPPPPRASETVPAFTTDDAGVDRMLRTLTQRGLKEWATTLPSGEARRFPADLVAVVVEQLETLLRLKGNSPSPQAKKVAVIVLCDHFEKAGWKNQDAVLGNVVRLFA